MICVGGKPPKCGSESENSWGYIFMMYDGVETAKSFLHSPVSDIMGPPTQWL